MDWDEYNISYRWHFQQDIKDFVSFIIHELNLDHQSRILEIGSGPGWISLDLARRLPDVEIVGLEQNAELIKIANQNKIQENITNVDFIHSTLENLEIFSIQSFDCIVSFKTLRSWNAPQQTFNEIIRILKSNGRYAITDYRNDLKWLAKASIWFTGRTMPEEFRSFWKESITNSYSLQEIVKILMQTKLKDWKIRTTLFDFLIYKA